jgi:Transcription factor WhiB
VPQPHYVTATHGDLTGLPSLRRILERERWREDAACLGEPTDHFFQETGSIHYKTPTMSSAAVLYPLLLFCDKCPVRAPCLRASLQPFSTIVDAEDSNSASRNRTARPFGTSGGATPFDRWQVHDLPIEAAVNALEETFRDRLAARIEAWRAAYAPRVRGASWRDARIVSELQARGQWVERFTVGGLAGPGRGRRGALLEYAAKHSCSKTTAWRLARKREDDRRRRAAARASVPA